MQKEIGFSKRSTNIVKGMAVLILCWHHLFWHNVSVPVDLKTASIMDVLVPVTKVCVALFTMLSGYGIYISFQKSNCSYKKFTFLHLKKLLINYWWIYIPVFILSFWFHREGTPIEIYGMGSNGIKNFLLDFLGLRAIIYSKTLNNTWWYMEAAFCFYLCFPLLYKALKKVPVLLLSFSVLPVLLASVHIFWTGFITTDRELFYLFPFVVGMELARRGSLNLLVKKAEEHKWEFLGYSLLGFVCICVIRTQVSMIVDTFYACSIILIGIGIGVFDNLFVKSLEFFGKHSMNIFLIHSMVYYYFDITKRLLDGINILFIKYLVLLFICLLCSYAVEYIKKCVHRVMEKIKILKQ